MNTDIEPEMIFYLLNMAISVIVVAALYALLHPWLFANKAREPVSFMQILSMLLRGSPAMRIVFAYVACKKSGLPVTVEDLEALYLSSPRSFQANWLALVKSGKTDEHESARSPKI